MRTNTNKFWASLDQSTPLQIGYSGGKDSLAVVSTYVEYLQSGGNPLDLVVVFSDTGLESRQLLEMVDKVFEFLSSIGIEAVKIHGKESFWSALFRGLALPDYRIRWCTDYLKIKPMEHSKRRAVVGTHLGESTARDKRLDGKTCGGSECGADLIKEPLRPIVEWRNCDVWEYILESEMAGNLPSGIFNKMSEMYAISEDPKSGSTRMGCIMCPVVAISTIQSSVEAGMYPEWALQVRLVLESHRDSPRILPALKGRKLGATTLESRKQLWAKLQPFVPEMLSYGAMTLGDVQTIEDYLARGVYPNGYKPEHIKHYEGVAIKPSEYQSGKRFDTAAQVRAIIVQDNQPTKETPMLKLPLTADYSFISNHLTQLSSGYFGRSIPLSELAKLPAEAGQGEVNTLKVHKLAKGFASGQNMVEPIIIRCQSKDSWSEGVIISGRHRLAALKLLTTTVNCNESHVSVPVVLQSYGSGSELLCTNNSRRFSAHEKATVLKLSGSRGLELTKAETSLVQQADSYNKVADRLHELTATTAMRILGDLAKDGIGADEATERILSVRSEWPSNTARHWKTIVSLVKIQKHIQ